MLVSQLDQPLVTVTGAAHLAFIGLTFEGSLGNGMIVKEGSQDLDRRVHVSEPGWQRSRAQRHGMRHPELRHA